MKSSSKLAAERAHANWSFRLTKRLYTKVHLRRSLIQRNHTSNGKNCSSGRARARVLQDRQGDTRNRQHMPVSVLCGTITKAHRRNLLLAVRNGTDAELLQYSLDTEPFTTRFSSISSPKR